MKSIKNVINMLKPGISLALNDIKDDFYCLNISWTYIHSSISLLQELGFVIYSTKSILATHKKNFFRL